MYIHINSNNMYMCIKLYKYSMCSIYIYTYIYSISCNIMIISYLLWDVFYNCLAMLRDGEGRLPWRQRSVQAQLEVALAKDHLTVGKPWIWPSKNIKNLDVYGCVHMCPVSFPNQFLELHEMKQVRLLMLNVELNSTKECLLHNVKVVAGFILKNRPEFLGHSVA